MKHGDIEFTLKDTFLSKYKRRKVNWGPLGYFTYKRTYARPLPGNKTEEWWQTVRRVVEGCILVQKQHCHWFNLPWSERKAQRSAQEMYALIFDFKFVPPGRGLWSMGTEFMFEKGGAALNNCGFVSTDEIKTDCSAPFVWLMDMSLYGVGVGFDTEGAELGVHLRKPRTDMTPHVVEDSREGWIELFRRILDSYSGGDTMPIHVDYTHIRPAGDLIKGFGGIAPGPTPLIKLIERTCAKCDEYVAADQAIDSTFIVDIMNFAGAAVVAGGIRRTAEIAFGTPSDEAFLDLKSQASIKNDKLARWASNNSILAEPGMDYTEAAKRAGENGEPGFFWLNNARTYGRMSDGRNRNDLRVKGCNPCGEQSLESFELCNLVETFPSRHDTRDEYTRTLKYAYMYAKTVTLIATHDPRTNAVMFRNRRIGLSQSGIMEQINKVGFRTYIDKWCEVGYATVQHWDEIYSDWLCVPRSRKTTTVKPSGTVSLLPGVTPGIHFPHSEYYIRRVQISSNSELIKIMRQAGYEVEKVKAADDTMVIKFPVHEQGFDRGKDDVSMWEQLELAAAMQAKWSDNQVSVTVTVRPGEERDIARALSMYEKRLKAVSFLPLRGDEVYEQPPYEKTTKEVYEKLFAKIKKVRYDVTDEEDRTVERFCDTESCEI